MKQDLIYPSLLITTGFLKINNIKHSWT